MKAKEALELFKDHKYMTDFSWQDEMSERAIEALEAADKYRWHDLRKSNKDFPEDGMRCLCARWDYVSKTVFYSLLWYCSGQWCHLDHRREEICDYAVVGWRYIEPFEPCEEEEE